MSATATRPETEAVRYGGTINLPAKCKPSKVLSKDGTRPILQHAYLRRRDDGLWLTATDAYIAVAIKVEGGAREGYVPGSALRHIEAGREAEQLSETAWRVQTEPYASTTYDIADAVRGAKAYPDLAGLGLWEQQKEGAIGFASLDDIAVGISPDLMHRLGAAFGAGNPLRFEIVGPLQPIRVLPLRTIEAVGLQMPVRLT